MASVVSSRRSHGNVARRVGVFRALQLGDMLCAVPALRAIRTGWPGAQVTLVGLPWAREFAARFDRYVDEFLEFPGWDGLPEREPESGEVDPFLGCARSMEFDLAIQLHGNGIITNEVVAALGAREVAGFHPAGVQPPAPGHWIEYPDHGQESERLLCLTRSLGLPDSGAALEFPVSDQEAAEAAALLGQYGLRPRSYAIVHPGGRSESRRWAAEGFARATGRLAAAGLDVVLTGAAPEAGVTADVARRAASSTINFAGKTSVGVLAALVREARLVLTNDTGVSHVAAAMKTRSVVVFTGSDIERWAPLDHTLHHAVPARAGDLDPADVRVVTRAIDTLLSPERAYVSV